MNTSKTIQLLNGLSIGGLIFTAASAIYCTVKATKVFNEKNYTLETFTNKETRKNVIKDTVKIFLPFEIAFASALGLGITGSIINKKFNDSLIGIIGGTYGAYNQLKQKVKDKMTEEQFDSLLNDIREEDIKNNPFDKKDNDKIVLYDENLKVFSKKHSNGFFESTISEYRYAYIQMIKGVINHGHFLANDFYSFFDELSDSEIPHNLDLGYCSDMLFEFDSIVPELSLSQKIETSDGFTYQEIQYDIPMILDCTSYGWDNPYMKTCYDMSEKTDYENKLEKMIMQDIMCEIESPK